mgnify:CR=1 FL=1
MPVFAYTGKTASGEVKKGQLEAANQNEARERLRKMNIKATSVKAKGAGGGFKIPNPFKGSVGTKDLVIFVRQFATMIDSGLPLVQCLDIQAKQAPNPIFREQLAHIKEQVETGSTFADSLRKYPSTFDELFRNMIAAGEVGGILDTILNRLAAYLEKADKLKRQIKGAMMYPTIVIVVSAAVIGVLLLKVVPTFEEMFADMGAALPAPTAFVIALSDWLQANFLFIVCGMIAAFFAFKAYYKTSKGQVIVDGVVLKAPVFGDLLTKVAVARFCRTLGTMVASGVPILEALDICGRTAGNKVIENAVLKVRDAISEGRTIAEPLMEAKVFPDMVCQMISVGEATGALDVMLSKVADFYEEEVDQAVENLTSMIEPIIIVFLGVIIGGLVIAMYMPIFSMASGI